MLPAHAPPAKWEFLSSARSRREKLVYSSCRRGSALVGFAEPAPYADRNKVGLSPAAEAVLAGAASVIWVGLTTQDDLHGHQKKDNDKKPK